MKITKIYDDITLEVPDSEGIYVPSEDTFLLIDMIRDYLHDKLNEFDFNQPALDMGSGSGIISLYLARYFKTIHAVDVNPNAVAFLQGEVISRHIEQQVTVFQSDLFHYTKSLKEVPRYSLASFNPPYLPPENLADSTTATLEGRALLDLALYSNGDGASILLEFLKHLKGYLAPRADVFLIKSSLTGIDDFTDVVEENGYHILEHREIHLFFEDIQGYHLKMT